MKKYIPYIIAGVSVLIVLLSLVWFFTRPKKQMVSEELLPPPTAAETTEVPEEMPTEPPPPNNYTAADFSINDQGYLICHTSRSLIGIDVSEYQGDIDWDAVAEAGIEFAIIRVGFRGYGENGKLVEDENARINLESALAAGLKVGAYFFSQATTPHEALQEARLTLGVIRDFTIEMPVVFDWEYLGDYARTAETDAATVTACTEAFCNAITLAGYQAMFYSNQNMSDSHFDLSALSDYPMWLAMYDTDMTFPHRLYMWQYADDGEIPGIEGTVDLNIYLPDTK